jgi:hypothetical protein
MKKIIFLTFFCLVFSWALFAQNSASPAKVEVSFNFHKQSGFSTNQFAVWIEDSRGNVVKTIFATKFTAGGGWSKRAESIPLWVSKSGLSSMNKNDIDAFSGATPRTGALSYRWDGLDKNGSSLPGGEYQVFLEATLKRDDRVLYSAPVILGNGGGNPVEAAPKAVYFGTGTKERGMVENVKVVYRP